MNGEENKRPGADGTAVADSAIEAIVNCSHPSETDEEVANANPRYRSEALELLHSCNLLANRNLVCFACLQISQLDQCNEDV